MLRRATQIWDFPSWIHILASAADYGDIWHKYTGDYSGRQSKVVGLLDRVGCGWPFELSALFGCQIVAIEKFPEECARRRRREGGMI